MTAEEWARIEFFKPAEFDSKDSPGSGFAHMQYELVSMLDYLRSEWGFPLHITSGYRTESRNAVVGGVQNSAHTRGLAADLETPNLQIAIKLAILAARLGFVRIGVDLSGKLVHVDVDKSLPQNVTWFYHEPDTA